MNLIRSLVLPWFLYFFAIVAAVVAVGIKAQLQPQQVQWALALLGVGALLCVMSNFRTFNQVGIWISYSLPISLRYTAAGWVFRAFQAAAVAAAFYFLGQFSWMPLLWQGIVVPVVFALTLFVGVWSLVGSILKWTSNIVFNRTIAFLLTLPILLAVPATAVYLGQTFLISYQASRAKPLVTEVASTPPPEVETAKPAVVKKAPVNPAVEQRAHELQGIAESGKPCSDKSKEISAALIPNGPEEVVYWAVKAVKCTEMRSVVGLPKLVKIMMEHPSARVRAASIRAMTKFGTENVRQVSYLIVKRISEKEPVEVIEAAATVLGNLGETERKYSTNRLKNLLDSPHSSLIAAKTLIEKIKREDLVVDYVSEHLTGTPDSRERAVGMICLLPEASRTIAEPHIDEVVATIKTGAKDDPAREALDCLGHTGFQAIRQEVLKPQKLDRPVAARALAQMDVKSAPEALETAEKCSRDENEQVRQWCSQSLGKIGAPALPKILDLLKSRDTTLKDAGKNALNFFNRLRQYHQHRHLPVGG